MEDWRRTNCRGQQMPVSPKRSSRKTTQKTPPEPELQASAIASPKRRAAAARADSPFATLVKKIQNEHGVLVADIDAQDESDWPRLSHEQVLDAARRAGIITPSGKLSARYK